jgi:hypothetical protein
MKGERYGTLLRITIGFYFSNGALCNMPSLKATDLTGTITWLGVVADSEKTLRAEKVQKLSLTFSGQEGECHAGLTRPSCSRVLDQFPRGTTIRNVRQLSIVSEEELALIAAEIGVDKINPAWLGASVVVRGIPDFSHIPPSSRLQKEVGGTTLCIDMENRPCIGPGDIVEEDAPGHGQAFKMAAEGRRGVTAWVECPGGLAIGDSVTVHIPDQRAWKPFAQYSINGHSNKEHQEAMDNNFWLIITIALMAMGFGVYIQNYCA